VVLDDQRRTKPLRIILDVLGKPFTRPFGQRSNERNRSLWENPDVVFAGGPFHCSTSVFANGGSGLIENSGRKTANVCDKHAKETTRNSTTRFTGLLSSFFSGNHVAKFLNIFRKTASERGAPTQRGRQFPQRKKQEKAGVSRY
jgi:hypothetical protein